MSQDASPGPQPEIDIGQRMAEHEGLVHWVVRHQYLGPLSYGEALQEGRLALWRALQGYDPTRGAFSTYAVPAIAHALWRAVSQAQADRREVLVPQPPQEAPDLEDLVAETWLQQALYRLVAALPRRLRQIVVAHYGLAGYSPQSFTAIGQALGISRQRVQQLHAAALLWLAHPAHSLALRQGLERNTLADYRAYLARQRAWRRATRRSP